MAEKGLIITCQLTIVPRFILAFLAGGGSGGGDSPSQITLSTMKVKDARVYLHDASLCFVHFALCGLLYLWIALPLRKHLHDPRLSVSVSFNGGY